MNIFIARTDNHRSCFVNGKAKLIFLNVTERALLEYKKKATKGKQMYGNDCKLKNIVEDTRIKKIKTKRQVEREYIT